MGDLQDPFFDSSTPVFVRYPKPPQIPDPYSRSPEEYVSPTKVTSIGRISLKDGDSTRSYEIMASSVQVRATDGGGVLRVKAIMVEDEAKVNGMAVIDNSSTDGASTTEDNSINGSAHDGTTCDIGTNCNDASAEVNINVSKAEDKLAMALIEKEVYTFKESLKVLNIRLGKIQSEADNQSQVLVGSIASLRQDLESMASKLRSVEGEKQNFVMAVQMDNGAIDRLNLRKAELRIMKLKSNIVEKEILIMEGDMALKEHAENNAKDNKALADVQSEVVVLTGKLAEKETSLEAMKSAFKAKYGESIDGISETAAAEHIKQIADLKAKTERLMPLYWIGHATRARFVEGEVRLVRGQGFQNMDRNIDLKSAEAWKLAKILSDAGLFLSFNENHRESSDEFVAVYGISPSVAWENRGFESLMNVLSWKVDMRKAHKSGHNPANFDTNCKEFLAKILPDFAISSDAQMEEDEELKKLYLNCKVEHDSVRPLISHPLNRRQNGGFNNNNGGFRNNNNNRSSGIS